MPAYAVAILSEARLNDEIRAYLAQIDATLQPYEGQYIIHGGPTVHMEGEPVGDLVVIRFPDLEQASRWYQSAAYQAIRPLRTANSRGTVFFIQGVAPGPSRHRHPRLNLRDLCCCAIERYTGAIPCNR